MATLPTNVGYGKVVGRFLLAVADTTGDTDHDPDAAIPVGTITFTPSVVSVKNITAEPPVELIPRPITCTVNAEGYMIDPTGEQGVWLVATDDTDNNPSGWTYTVTVIFPSIGYNRSYSIAVPEGIETDLALVSPVVSSPGNAIVLGPEGEPGQGVPAGGLEGQILARAAGPDYSTEWVDPPSGTGGGGDVISVNAKTGIVVLNADDIAPTTARRYLPSGGSENQTVKIVGGVPVWSSSAGSVTSVNGESGAVVLDASDVGALPSTYVPAWTDITGKPSTFTPSSHTHTASEVTDLNNTPPSQAEAEAGTATTARVWTAQRVAQAIVALAPAAGDVTSVNGETGDVLLDAADVGASALGHVHDVGDITGTGVSNYRVLGKATGAFGMIQLQPEHFASTYVDGTAGTASFRTLGTGAQQAAAGNHNHDSRYYTETETDTLLSGKASASHTHPSADITDLVTYTTPSQAEAEAGTATTARVWTAERVKQSVLALTPDPAWTDITGKPSVFPPDTHTHTADDVSPTTARRYLPSGGTEGQIVKIVGGVPAWGTDTGGSGGTGAVDSVNGLTGDVLIWMDVVLDAASAASEHDVGSVPIVGGDGMWTPAVLGISNISGLSTALDDKADLVHTHVAADVTDFNTEVDARISAAVGTVVQGFDSDLSTWATKSAPLGTVVGHTDTQTLTNKTMSGSSNTFSNIPQSAITDLATDLASKASTTHTHVVADLTDVSVVPQAEAEAGTATTTRWWTAQRVKQAIEALANVGVPTVAQADAPDATGLDDGTLIVVYESA